MRATASLDIANALQWFLRVEEADVKMGSAFSAVSSLLAARFGVGNFDFATVECLGFLHTNSWWTSATIVIITRGACQANIPFGRDASGLLYIDPCDMEVMQPQLNPVPDYFITRVHRHRKEAHITDCNMEDFNVNTTALAGDVSLLLQDVHPR